MQLRKSTKRDSTMPRKVNLLPHDPTWADKYQEEADRLAAVLSPEIIALHHIGSTAIPDIVAKPIIDILIEVKEINQIDLYNDQMTTLGYAARGENGIPGRRYFSKDTEGVRTHHVHIFQVGNPEIDRHIKFCNHLITQPDDAQAYNQLKIELAKIFPEDVDQYTEAKSDFIQNIDEKIKSA
jgi:GrpB-like predicted nucleotidyltransferase (UPF0157 family)